MVANHQAVRQRVQFAFNADVESVVGTVFQYLIKSRHFNSREGKRKGVDAIVAFYKPFAFQGCEGITEDELRAIAQDAVDALSRQIELIHSTFGVERSETSITDFKHEVKTAIAEVIFELPIRVCQSSPGEACRGVMSESNAIAQFADDSGLDFDEEALFGDLYTNAEAAA